ncbi:hypothetical protein, partial [Bacteroides sp. 51]|uniref:hypothetical protein n=1 Tax=Bacteroides sp. 51 TaxID=2302938 RepID=UPI0019402914
LNVNTKYYLYSGYEIIENAERDIEKIIEYQEKTYSRKGLDGRRSAVIVRADNARRTDYVRYIQIRLWIL